MFQNQSFYIFVLEILPLVEFELESGITDEEAEKLIEEPVESTDNVIDTENQFTVSTNQTDLFMARLVQYEVYTHQYSIIVLQIP